MSMLVQFLHDCTTSFTFEMADDLLHFHQHSWVRGNWISLLNFTLFVHIIMFAKILKKIQIKVTHSWSNHRKFEDLLVDCRMCCCSNNLFFLLFSALEKSCTTILHFLECINLRCITPHRYADNVVSQKIK